MSKDLESDIEKFLVKKVRERGGIAYKWVSAGHAGVPDRIVIMPHGKVIFVELKTIAGRVSKAQNVQINLLRRLGCDVRILKGRDAVMSFVEEIGAQDNEV